MRDTSVAVMAAVPVTCWGEAAERTISGLGAGRVLAVFRRSFYLEAEDDRLRMNAFVGASNREHQVERISVFGVAVDRVVLVEPGVGR